MAFPFDLTVAEFSNAIFNATHGEGYAVVNILNDETPVGGKPAFKLWMREIPANLLRFPVSRFTLVRQVMGSQYV